MRLNKEELAGFEAMLIKRGYRKFGSGNKYKSEDYAFWKSFGVNYLNDGDKERDYQVAFLVYDWTKYPNHDNKIGIALEFLIGDKDLGLPQNIGVSISDDNVTVEQFEQLCENFFNFLKQQKWTERDTLQKPS